ncbi:MAG: hypothetical protein M1429_03680 [Patescibacteria group bacterium]|nr:hypothetical protein [Patescibacteria group bacterium]
MRPSGTIIHPEKHHSLLAHFTKIASLKPNYINLHGPKIWWQPPAREYVQRYANRSEPKEYFKLLDSTNDLITRLKNIFPHLTFENTTLCDYYKKDERFLPQTSYQTNIGSLDDCFYIHQKTKIELLFDLEHLILNLNFLDRQKNYRDLPKEPVENQTVDEKKLKEIFGFNLQKGLIPYLDKKIESSDFLKQNKIKHYHVTGSTQDVKGDQDITHGPIKKDDQVFRQNLRLILAQNPETILIETASSYDNACYHYLRPNETELSFYQLCEILLEEL